jgi:hypothetical protein
MMKKGLKVFGQNWENSGHSGLGGQVFDPLLITNPQLRGFCFEKVSISEMKTTDMQI